MEHTVQEAEFCVRLPLACQSLGEAGPTRLQAAAEARLSRRASALQASSKACLMPRPRPRPLADLT